MCIYIYIYIYIVIHTYSKKAASGRRPTGLLRRVAACVWITSSI